MNTATIILLVVLAAIVFCAIFAYNTLVRLVNRAKEAWSDIDVQLKRRYNLIPNLVETVKGYATHEKTVFEDVTEARTAAMGASPATPADQLKNENMLSGALKSLFAVSENYPELKANQNFLQLQQELGDTEDKIQAARRFYNSTVMALNTAIQMFPNNLISGMFHFSTMQLFEIDEADAAAKDPVKVQF